jgi:hypothetical protein
MGKIATEKKMTDEVTALLHQTVKEWKSSWSNA